MCGFCGTSRGWERSAGCGILGGGSVGLVIVSEALVGGVSWACGGFCSTSGPDLSIEGRWIVSIFRSATERERHYGQVRAKVKIMNINESFVFNVMLNIPF